MYYPFLFYSFFYFYFFLPLSLNFFFSSFPLFFFSSILSATMTPIPSPMGMGMGSGPGLTPFDGQVPPIPPPPCQSTLLHYSDHDSILFFNSFAYCASMSLKNLLFLYFSSHLLNRTQTSALLHFCEMYSLLLG